jgi:transposase-like protein
MIELRWPDGKVKCPRCGSERIFYIEKERVWKCYGKHDQAKFSLKTEPSWRIPPSALISGLPHCGSS